MSARHAMEAQAWQWVQRGTRLCLSRQKEGRQAPPQLKETALRPLLSLSPFLPVPLSQYVSFWAS